MTLIPKSHPRAKSLLIREKLVDGFDKGLVAKEGLLAQGRGEAFDYLLGEKTGKSAQNAIRAASSLLLQAQKPVISVNGNIAALCPREIVNLAKITNSKLEVNLFYATEKRKRVIVRELKKYGASKIYGTSKTNSTKLNGIDSARRIVDKNGIFDADVVLVPLEDGDRTNALKKSGKKVISFDLNPMSRTAISSDITIVDNVVRGIHLLIKECKKNSKKTSKNLEKILKDFDNKNNLKSSIVQINSNLERMKKFA
jgi:4-phosphopantoate--beta-alanine ligase